MPTPRFKETQANVTAGLAPLSVAVSNGAERRADHRVWRDMSRDWHRWSMTERFAVIALLTGFPVAAMILFSMGHVHGAPWL
jgi:hypothetical protein